MISAIVAIGHNRVIGKGNTLLWPIPDDLKRFKALTMGHPIIMGRKTFDSIGRVLPGRTNIVITRDPEWQFQDSQGSVLVARSIKEALEKARATSEEIFVIGGAQIYEQSLPHVDKLYVTLIDDEKEGDAYFPEYENIFTKMTFHEDREHEGLKYKWVDLER